jgi:uncharacterized protein involved in response to NO
MTLLTIEDTSAPGPGKRLLSDPPLLRLGFRPFYLLAATLAAISVPLWLARYFGMMPRLAHVDLNWHMHEMIFGFAIAVIIGFLYTAGRNWTGLWTPRRGALAAIAGLWIAGRAAMLLADPLPAALIDLAFLPVATWPLYRVLQRAGNKRNLFLVLLLGLLTASNLGFHAARLGWLTMAPTHPVHAAIMIIVIIETAIGGRVIPMFTANAVRGVKTVVNQRRDRIALAFTAGAGLAWICVLPGPLVAGIAIAAAAAQATRLAGWKPFCTLRNPLLWILHVSYAWLVAGLALLALAALGVVSASAAFHVLAVGSMAGLILGMITRTALGHTGRTLAAGNAETVMYALMQAGVLARLAAAIGPDAWRNGALVLAAASWTAAFVLYLIVYAPYLFRARIDGKEG